MSSSFNEFYNKKTGLTVGIEQLLFSEKTPYQKVDIYETDTWGNMLAIDDMVMLSEKDEFVYHEMLSHVGLFSHPDPGRVLIVGGGDGGTAREVMRHASVRQVDIVEIDEAVIRSSKKYLPAVGDWDNPKLNVLIQDGIQFVKAITEPYDMIIIDGSDPVGPAKGLFDDSFMKACYEGLTENGVFAAQAESPWVGRYRTGMEQFFEAQRNIFELSKMYLAYIPLYPAGMWSFSLASKGADPLDEDAMKRVKAGLQEFDTSLKYYNESVHKACFALPNFVVEIIK